MTEPTAEQMNAAADRIRHAAAVAQVLRDAAENLDLPGCGVNGYYGAQADAGYREAEQHAREWLLEEAARLVDVADTLPCPVCGAHAGVDFTGCVDVPPGPWAACRSCAAEWNPEVVQPRRWGKSHSSDPQIQVHLRPCLNCGLSRQDCLVLWAFGSITGCCDHCKGTPTDTAHPEGILMTNDQTDEQFSVSRGNPNAETTPLIEWEKRTHDRVANALTALDSLTRTIIRPSLNASDRFGSDDAAAMELSRIIGEARAYRQVLGYPEGDLDG